MKKIAAYRFLFFHVLFLVALYYLLHLFGICRMLPFNSSLLQWDANWYNSIQSNGYSYSEKIQSNAGFFPLFPLLWKLFGCNAFGISCVNAAIALLSVALLTNAFKVKPSHTLLFLSIPSIFFLYIPYAESLFFLASTILLIGIKKDRIGWVVCGLILASLTKATSLFLIPAGIFMLFTQQAMAHFNLRNFSRKAFIWAASVLTGTMLVVFIQYQKTGVWFAYFKAQSMHWSRSFSFPVFPLTTWDASRILTLDATAFIIGLLAIAICCYHFWDALRKNHASSFTKDKAYLFSVAFLALVLVSILFFNPLDAATNSTSILSINRYLFASPFLLVFINYHLTSSQLTKKQLLVAVLLLIAAGLLFNAYSGKKNALIFILLIGYLSTYLFVLFNVEYKKYWPIAYLINCILQAILFNSFLEGLWLG